MTKEEFLKRINSNVDKLIELMKADGNLELVTDMKRSKSYL